mmetsp:Transcript_1411/g.2591  ORF Transcript_1411/g.2591 Transcript_1411/m.2591 type:complete len:1395 (-) Transcript_1411:931-5115(-)
MASSPAALPPGDVPPPIAASEEMDDDGTAAAAGGATTQSPLGRRRRTLQRRSVSANAVSDVFCRPLLHQHQVAVAYHAQAHAHDADASVNSADDNYDCDDDDDNDNDDDDFIIDLYYSHNNSGPLLRHANHEQQHDRDRRQQLLLLRGGSIGTCRQEGPVDQRGDPAGRGGGVGQGQGRGLGRDRGRDRGQEEGPPRPLLHPLLSGGRALLSTPTRLTDTLGLIHPSAAAGGAASAAAAHNNRTSRSSAHQAAGRRWPRHRRHHTGGLGGAAAGGTGGSISSSATTSSYPPVISPFRMMPTASNTLLSRRIKNMFGLAVVVVVCTVAPLELRAVWRGMERHDAAAAASASSAAAAADSPSTVDVMAMDKEQQEKSNIQQESSNGAAAADITTISSTSTDGSTAAAHHHQRSGPFHPNPILGPDPGPFAIRAYANLHPPTRPESIFGRISRHLLNLRLRISSRRNERLDYLEALPYYGGGSSGAGGGIGGTSDRSSGGSSGYYYDDDEYYDNNGGLYSYANTTKRQRRRDRRQRRKERRQAARTARQQVVTPYTILDAERLYQRMVELTRRYPELVRLENSQEEFGLPVAGGPDDCTFEPKELGDGCHNWYLVIEDAIYNGNQADMAVGVEDVAAAAATATSTTTSGPLEAREGGDGGRDLDNNGRAADADRYDSLPEVLLSGALHGDERVGPTAVLETAAILLESAWCESLPRVVLGDAMGGKRVSDEVDDEPSRRIKKKVKSGNRYRRHKTGGWQRRRRRRRRSKVERRQRVIRSAKVEKGEQEYIAQKMRQRRQELLAQEDVQRPRSTAATYYPPDQLDEARICRASLSSRGIAGAERRWLARLVSTRRIVILPTANALGYARNVRHEGDKQDLDPNRDFPFDLADPTMCMRTVAARTVNELFRQHLFQMASTFHGGMEAVAYEWGAPSFQLSGKFPQSSAESYAAPDSISQKQISRIYSSFGGKLEKNGGDMYPIGTMNELVYPVAGGMEDWSYAASWDTDRVVQCTPSTYGGYPAEKTSYGSSSLRTFNALVETSNEKTPYEEDVGTDEDLLTPWGAGNGHIPRNIRLSLALIDLVEPYVQILDAAGREIRDDVVPLSPRHYRSAMKTKVMTVPEGTGNTTIGWTVGGAISVDSTALMVGKWEDLDGTVFDGVSQPTKQQLDDYFASVSHGNDPIVSFSEAQGPGPTRWNERLGYYDPVTTSHTIPTTSASSYREDASLAEAVYRTQIDLSNFVEGDRIAVHAIARVDQSWAGREDNVLGSLRPQTNVVNARTDPDWRQEEVTDEGIHKVVQGRLDWFSIPLTIEVVAPRGPMLETSVRSPNEEWAADFVPLSSHGLLKALLAGAALAAVVSVCVLFRERKDGEDCFNIRRSGDTSLSLCDDDDLEYAIS